MTTTIANKKRRNRQRFRESKLLDPQTCESCGATFNAPGQRKTCSSKCRYDMVSAGQLRIQLRKADAHGMSIKEASQKVGYVPTLEEIEEKTRMIKEGRLIVGNRFHIVDGVRYETQY